MKDRIKIHSLAPDSVKAMFGLETYLNSTTLDALLKELIKIPGLANQRLRLLHSNAFRVR